MRGKVIDGMNGYKIDIDFGLATGPFVIQSIVRYRIKRSGLSRNNVEWILCQNLLSTLNKEYTLCNALYI